LLTPPTYALSWNVGRRLFNLPASLEVLEILPASTVENWLQRLQQGKRP